MAHTQNDSETVIGSQEAFEQIGLLAISLREVQRTI